MSISWMKTTTTKTKHTLNVSEVKFIEKMFQVFVLVAMKCVFYTRLSSSVHIFLCSEIRAYGSTDARTKNRKIALSANSSVANEERNMRWWGESSNDLFWTYSYTTWMHKTATAQTTILEFTWKLKAGARGLLFFRCSSLSLWFSH